MAPYPERGFRVRIPAEIWAQTLDVIRRYANRSAPTGREGSEGLVYLSGVPTSTEVLVTGLLELGHLPQGDRVVVTREEARWLVRSLAVRDEKLIAQVHSLRELAGHSAGDDTWATSFHEGFVSIVVPRFGIKVNSVTGCAVLEYQGGAFRDLSPDEVARRILIQPEHALMKDVREESRWSKFARKLKSTGLSKR